MNLCCEFCLHLPAKFSLSIRDIDTTFFVAMAELWTPDCTTNVTMIADPTLPAAHRGPQGFVDSDSSGLPSAVYLSNPGYLYGQSVTPQMVHRYFSHRLDENADLICHICHQGAYPAMSPQSQPMYPMNSTFPNSTASLQGLGDPLLAGTPYSPFASSNVSMNPQGSFYPGVWKLLAELSNASSCPSFLDLGSLGTESKPMAPYSYPLASPQNGFYDPSFSAINMGASAGARSPRSQSHSYPLVGSSGLNTGSFRFGID